MGKFENRKKISKLNRLNPAKEKKCMFPEQKNKQKQNGYVCEREAQGCAVGDSYLLIVYSLRRTNRINTPRGRSTPLENRARDLCRWFSRCTTQFLRAIQYPLLFFPFSSPCSSSELDDSLGWSASASSLAWGRALESIGHARYIPVNH